MASKKTWLKKRLLLNDMPVGGANGKKAWLGVCCKNKIRFGAIKTQFADVKTGSIFCFFKNNANLRKFAQ
jgi:hypothetical protein